MTRFSILAILFFLPLTASANFQTDLIRGKKGPTDDKVQWTLVDWLDEKKKMSLMDQWLALHSGSSWFDLSVSGAAQQLTVRTTNATTHTSTTQNGQQYTMDIYISILNLNGEYQKTDEPREEYGGAAGLRLFGGSSQSTNLVGRYGWHRTIDLKTPEQWDNQYAEGALQLYIISAMGLNGQYRYYFPADSSLGKRMQGHRVTAGAFVEFLVFRIYANYFQEPMEISDKGVVTTRAVDGFDGGLKLLF